MYLSCSDRFYRDEDDSNKYVIGFSQCTSGDLWRQMMNSEMIRETSFYPEITLIIKDGQQNNQKQISDIEELINQGIDLLIVSPNEAEPITAVVEETYHSGIPVILIDRKIASDAYTAYIGGDNFAIGREAGNYARGLLKDKGKILEIWGLKGSSPAVERHRGFVESLEKVPGIKILDGGDGKWLGEIGEQLAEEAFENYHDIDLVYAHNDVMALGAYRAAKRRGIEKKMNFVGIDALPGEEGGIQMVLNGYLTATFLYPTGGEYAIHTALKILKNQPFKREYILETVQIDSTNARILKLQTDQILNHQAKIEAQKRILDQQLLKIETHRERFYVTLVGLGIVLIIVFFLWRSYRIIKRINKQLEEKNEAINHQKEELAAQRDQLVEMHQKLKEANELKIQFFTNISHEFRTPLTLIIGTLDQIRNPESQNDETQKKVSLMQRNAERLLRLINQLMDFRKLDDGKMHLHAHKHDIVSFLNEITQSFEILAEQKEIDFQFRSSIEKLEVWFDDEKLDKVIFNLLSNAFKFTPEGGSIVVECRLWNEDLEKAKSEMCEFVEIRVKDTGIGIPPEEIIKIFEPFYEVEHKRRTHYTGTGIGLALSKSLVELHHGEILVDSSDGQGSCFTVRLPLGNQHLIAGEMPDGDLSDAVFDHSTPLVTTPESDEPEKLAVGAGRISQATPLILIVDDNPDVVTYITSCLESQYRVDKAENGKLGLDKAIKLMPDLIISDIMMPEMDGIEFCSKLKSDLETSHIPVILLTARSSDENIVEGFETGADDYITKPFNSEILKARVHNLLESHKKLKEYFTQSLTFYSKDSSIRTIDKKFIERMIETVEKNLLNPEINVDRLGKELGLTRVHLYRKIKSLTGHSPSEFVRLIKLKKAAELMKDTELSVAEVAFKVGFETPSYFTKCFREHFQQTPTEYILNHTTTPYSN